MAQLEIKPTAMMRFRVLAVIWIAVGITAYMMYLLTGGGGELFAPRVTLVTYMPDATGLTDLSPVLLSGIPIGQVKNVDVAPGVDPQRAVRVEMRVKKRFLKNIPQDSMTSIDAENLVGDKFVSIDEGKSPIAVENGGQLQSEPVKQATDRADLIRTVHQNLAEVDQMLSQIASGETQMGRFLLGEDEYDTVLARVSDFDRAVHTFITPRSDLGKAFYTQELYDHLREPILRIDKMLVSIQNGEGTAGQLFASDAQYTNTLAELRELREALAGVNAGKGRFGLLLKDDADYRKIEDLLKATDAVITSFTAGEGKVGSLLANPQFYESLNGSLRGLEELLRDLHENPQKYFRYKVF